MKQVQFSQFGSPEVLNWMEAEIPQPKAGELIIRVEAIGVNYSDILRRRNQYFQPTPLPYILGSEAVGEIISLGENLDGPFQLGSKVLAILPFGGGYSEFVQAQAHFCIPIPPNLDVKLATAIFVQGTTAELMISQMAGDLKGKTVLINAAAGGVGSILVQLAKLKGAKVIAGCSSDRKLEFAKQKGADEGVNYSKLHWDKELKHLTQGNGIDLVFEMVGGEVYNESIKSLVKGGKIIVYGCAGGKQGSIHPEYFVDQNIHQSGFNLAYFISNKMSVWQQSLGNIMDSIIQKRIKIETPDTFPLKEAFKAHQKIEARETTGKVVLVP